MTEKRSDQEGSGELFSSLVVMLSTSALQQLGKLVNPLTRKAEVNLEAAQMTIDMLEMLRTKTKGNLNAAEKGMLDEIIASLQMAYVQTSAAASAAAPGTAAPPPEAQRASVAGTPAADRPAGATPRPAEAKDPKYHKTYGA